MHDHWKEFSNKFAAGELNIFIRFNLRFLSETSIKHEAELRGSFVISPSRDEGFFLIKTFGPTNEGGTPFLPKWDKER